MYMWPTSDVPLVTISNSANSTCKIVDKTDLNGIQPQNLESLHYKNRKGEQKLRIITELSTYWKKLSNQLGYKHEQFAEGHSPGTASFSENCCRSVFRKWLDGGGTNDYPSNWNGLIKLINDIEVRRIARMIEVALECII